jgi:O-antigen/teichoic acid export membrane protein
MATQTEPVRNLTSGRLLARNTIWNLSASGASIFIALFSVPILLRYLGTDRFGVISLVWIVEGQFGIFDVGLSQALTKLVSEKLGVGREEEIPSIFWGCLLIMTGFGLLGAVLLKTLSPWLVLHALKVPLAIREETLTSFGYVAISLPVVISSAGLRGLLAAYQRFDLLNLVRIPTSLFCYLVPLVVLPFSRKLGPFIFVVVLSRFLTWLVHLLLCFHVRPGLLHSLTIRDAPFKRMFSFGGWMTVTNIVSPIMVNMDRILIGSLISVAAVAYYATPYEAVTKMYIIPSAITGVLFPALSTAWVQDRWRVVQLYERAVKYIFLSLFPVVLGVLCLGHWGMQLWLGGAFSERSTVVLHLLALGVFANSLAQVPFWQIQAANRPDLGAKVHVVELTVYLPVFWFLTKHYGISGASVAWMLRSSIDAVVMFWLSNRLLPENKASIRRLATMAAAATPFLVMSSLIENHILALSYFLLVLAGFMVIAWLFLLTSRERELVQSPLHLLNYKRGVPLGAVETP